MGRQNKPTFDWFIWFKKKPGQETETYKRRRGQAEMKKMRLREFKYFPQNEQVS